MRVIIFTLLLGSGVACYATPVTYYFHGVTSDSLTNNGPHDALLPIVRSDGKMITNGDSVMTGEIVLDPDSWLEDFSPEDPEDGYGSGTGGVLSWKLTTQGLDYRGPGGRLRNFHYLEFDDNQFIYFDELPTGGYDPDVVGLSFDFDTIPFARGPAHFPVESFIRGSFFIADIGGIDAIGERTNDDLIVDHIGGVITKMWTKDVAVPEPSSLPLLAGGMFLLCCRRLKAVK